MLLSVRELLTNVTNVGQYEFYILLSVLCKQSVIVKTTIIGVHPQVQEVPCTGMRIYLFLYNYAVTD